MNIEQLRDLQQLPLEYKVMITKQRIQEWYEHWDGKVFVSFSGGKDSTVLLHLARELYPNIPAVFVDTGLEYPEIRAFVKSVDNVLWMKPKTSFKQVLEKYGYPVISKKHANAIRKLRNGNLSDRHRNYLLYGDERGSIGKLSDKWKYLIDAPFQVSERCCDVMKKEPLHRAAKMLGRPFVGVMAYESRMRTTTYLEYGCNAYDNKEPISQPIGFWLESDVWEYLHRNFVPYCPIYDMGYDRTGCMFCMFGVHMEQEPNRFQRMQYTHPKQWKYCMYDLGLKDVLDYINVPWSDDNMLWSTEELLEGIAAGLS